MAQNCEALTLRTYPFAEANKIVVFLTQHQGLLRGVAYGARKSGGRFGSSLEPFTHLNVTYKRREHQELAVIQNCEIIRPLPAFDLNWEQSLHLGYFAELLLEFGREEEASNRLFRLSLAVLGALDLAPIRMLARYFEFWILSLEGILPTLDKVLSGDLAKQTASVLKRPPSELGQSGWTESDLRELERAAEKLIEYHLEKPLKAKRMLKELL